MSAGGFNASAVSSAGMVDVIFADVAQPDQTRIVALNAHNFLKNGGHFVISIKVRHTSGCYSWLVRTQETLNGKAAVWLQHDSFF